MWSDADDGGGNWKRERGMIKYEEAAKLRMDSAAYKRGLKGRYPSWALPILRHCHDMGETKKKVTVESRLSVVVGGWRKKEEGTSEFIVGGEGT